MSGKVKPLTKAEWDTYKRTHFPMHGAEGRRVMATLDALFAYRERTRGADMVRENCGDTWLQGADEIAAELGLE